MFNKNNVVIAKKKIDGALAMFTKASQAVDLANQLLASEKEIRLTEKEAILVRLEEINQEVISVDNEVEFNNGIKAKLQEFIR
ncbi:hypothetical protein ACFQZE_06460 [Paenibacillus sp. GCM10027627]|uniref:hypothetical protein n=1 Tax=unclassified Paenibacillus TaxID=185978 RepID=UPI00362DE56E